MPTLQASPQALSRLLDDKSPITPLVKLKFKEIFDKFEVLVKMSSTRVTTTRYRIKKNSVFDPAPNFLRGEDVEHVRTFSPLELIATAILVSYHMDTRSDAELLEDVKEMRQQLRIKHKDLRVNAQCWITAWEYIMGLEKRRPSASNLPDAESSSGIADGKTIGGSVAPLPTKSSNPPKTSSKRTVRSDCAQDSPKKRSK